MAEHPFSLHPAVIGGIPAKKLRFAYVKDRKLYTADGWRAHCGMPLPDWLADVPDGWAVQRRPNGELWRVDTFPVLERMIASGCAAKVPWDEPVCATATDGPVKVSKAVMATVRAKGYYRVVEACRPHKLAPIGTAKLEALIAKVGGKVCLIFSMGRYAAEPVLDECGDRLAIEIGGNFTFMQPGEALSVEVWNAAVALVPAGSPIRKTAWLADMTLIGADPSQPHAYFMRLRLAEDTVFVVVAAVAKVAG